MPAPDPRGITIEPQGEGWALLMETFLLSGRTQRKARARRILANLTRDGWTCHACGDLVPEYRRADARYCCEGCRKRHSRTRRNSNGKK